MAAEIVSMRSIEVLSGENHFDNPSDAPRGFADDGETAVPDRAHESA